MTDLKGSMDGSENPSIDGSTEPLAKAIMDASMERSTARAAYNEALLRPLVETIYSQQETIREQAERIGRLRVELEHAQQQLQAALEPPTDAETARPTLDEAELEEPPRGWWGRVLARIYG